MQHRDCLAARRLETNTNLGEHDEAVAQRICHLGDQNLKSFMYMPSVKSVHFQELNVIFIE